MGSQRWSDSAIVQLVFALEKASVAAVKRDISILCGPVEVESDGTEPLAFGVLAGIALGSWVDVIDAGSFEGLGEGGGVGKTFGGFWRDAMDSASSVFSTSRALRKFSKPLKLGTRKLYVIGPGAVGGRSFRL